MKNKLLLLFIISIFTIIFIIFYKGLKNTNVYTPDIKINKEEITASLDSIKNNDFSISIGLLEATRYITNRTIEKGHIVGDAEKAFVLINILKSTNIDLSVLVERNFGHIPGVLSYLASIKINQNTDVTIPQDKLGQKLRSMSIRLDRLEALGKQK